MSWLWEPKTESAASCLRSSHRTNFPALFRFFVISSRKSVSTSFNLVKMQQRSRFNEDPFTSPLPETPPSAAIKWAHRVSHPARFSGIRITPFRIGVALFFIASFVWIRDWVPRTPKVSLKVSVNNLY